MPVSGGCPAFVPAMMGAAFAPIAVTGGMSILAYRGREEDETVGVTVKQTHVVTKTSWNLFTIKLSGWGWDKIYLNLVKQDLNETEIRRDSEERDIDDWQILKLLLYWVVLWQLGKTYEWLTEWLSAHSVVNLSVLVSDPGVHSEFYDWRKNKLLMVALLLVQAGNIVEWKYYNFGNFLNI